MCVPRKYLQSAPSWFSAIPGLDNSYTDLWVIFPSTEVLASVPDYKPSTYPINGVRQYMDVSVLAANRSAITGRSGAQERLLEVAASSSYREVSGTDLLRIDHYDEYNYWSLVRWRPDGYLPSSLEELHHWIAAYCSNSRVNDDLNDCSIQRLFGNITYSFTVADNNIGNIEPLELFVESHFSEWRQRCQK